MVAFYPEDLGPAALMEGCRHGLTIAIRRGDLDLARTCFDFLWGEAKGSGRAWLRWAMVAIVCAEVMPLSAYLPVLRDQLLAVSKDSEDEERLWRRLVYQATLLPKSRDALALARFGWYATVSSDHREVSMAKQVRQEAANDIRLAVSSVFDRAMHGSSASKLGRMYQLLMGRANEGGGWSRRMTMVLTIMLFDLRKAEKHRTLEQIERMSQHGAEQWGRKPNKVPLPWYVFGPSTKIGGAAIVAFSKDYSSVVPWSRVQLTTVWEIAEDQHVPSKLMLGPPENKPLSVWNNLWAGLVNAPLIREPELLDTWVTQVKPHIALLVDRAATGRKHAPIQ